MVLAIILIVGLIFTGACGAGAFYFRKKLVQLRGVELTTVEELNEGMGKIYGEVVAAEDPIKSPVGGTTCVYYSLMISEEEIREVPFERREGNRIIRGTRTERKMVSILTEDKFISIKVKDDTGSAYVDLDGATVMLKKKGKQISGRIDSLSDKAFSRLCKMFPKLARRFETKKCEYTESVIEEQDEILVMGPVTFDNKDRAIIAVEKKKPFVVSDLTDEELQKNLKKWFLILAIGAGVFLVGTIIGAILAAK